MGYYNFPSIINSYLFLIIDNSLIVLSVSYKAILHRRWTSFLREGEGANDGIYNSFSITGLCLCMPYYWK